LYKGVLYSIMLIDHIKYNNIINYISYLCNLVQGKVGFGPSTTLARGIPSPKHPRSPENSQSSEDHEMVKAFGHGLFPGVFDIKIIINYILFGLRSFTLQEL
jgi:hypothetical protein